MDSFHVESFIVGFSIASVLFLAYNISDLLNYWSYHDED